MSKQKIIRTIRIEKNGNEGCRTVYSKGGVDRVVGSGRHTQTCQQFLNNIKGNLEQAAWSCKDVSRSSISVSGELDEESSEE